MWVDVLCEEYNIRFIIILFLSFFADFVKRRVLILVGEKPIVLLNNIRSSVFTR